MKRKRVWRYYCDFCKKSGCGRAAMAWHEQRCINNPARVQWMSLERAPFAAKIIKALRDGAGVAYDVAPAVGRDSRHVSAMMRWMWVRGMLTRTRAIGVGGRGGRVWVYALPEQGVRT